MSNPYLRKDESLILSTHHIHVNADSFELMLTSQRLILIDTRVAPFVLQSIPLVTIIAVTGWQNAGGEPIITLSYIDPGGAIAAHPVDLIFSSVHAEKRTQECDDWAQKLKKHAVLAREEGLRNGTLPYDPVKVLQPKEAPVRRIETFLPYKRIPGGYFSLAEPTQLPTRIDSPGTRGEEPVSADPGIPEYQETDLIPAPDQACTSLAEPEPLECSKNEKTRDLAETDFEVSHHVLSVEAATLFSDGRESGFILSSFPEELSDSRQAIPGEKNSGSGGIQTAADQHLQESIIGAGTAPPSTQIEEAEETGGIPGGHGETEGIPVTGAPEYRGTEKPVVSPDEKPGVTEPEFHEPGTVENVWAEAARTVNTVPPIIPGLRVGGESLPEFDADVKTVDVHASEGDAASREKIQPVPEMTQQPSASPPAAPGCRSGWYPAIIITVIVSVVLAITAGSFMVTPYLFNAPVDTPLPVVISTPPVQPAPVVQPISPETVLTLPKTGVWVRIIYPGTFFGTVGNPELMKPVRGSGDQTYSIKNSDGIVQVSIQKEDNSGDMLTIEVIKNSTVIKRSATRVPRGSIDILIDARTERPPGIKPGDIP